jgi:hypothetical protein
MLETPRGNAGSFSYHPENSLEVADEGFLEMMCPDTHGPEHGNPLLRFTLPPVELRLPGFKTREDIIRNRFPTPLDRRGLVDVGALIELVKGTVHWSYRWPGYSDEHHTLWPAYRYQYVQAFAPETQAEAFRNLAENKIWVPRVFHNWTHIVTDPPEVPPVEVMSESVQEWAMIRDFFNSVRETTQKMRMYDRERARRKDKGTPFTKSQEESLAEDMHRRVGGVMLHCKGLADIDLSKWSISMEMGLHAAAGQIGDLVLRGSQRRTKEVRKLAELAGV